MQRNSKFKTKIIFKGMLNRKCKIMFKGMISGKRKSALKVNYTENKKGHRK